MFFAQLQFQGVVLGGDGVLLVVSLEDFLVPPRVLLDGDDEEEAAEDAEADLDEEELANFLRFLHSFFTRGLHEKELVFEKLLLEALTLAVEELAREVSDVALLFPYTILFENSLSLYVIEVKGARIRLLWRDF